MLCGTAVWHIAEPVWHRQLGHNPPATLRLPPPDFPGSCFGVADDSRGALPRGMVNTTPLIVPSCALLSETSNLV
jgi:hypothetical protein